VISDYVNQGGHVLATGDTAILDEYGSVRPQWGLANLVNANVSQDVTWPIGTRIAGEDLVSSPYPNAMLKITPHAKSSLMKVLFNAVDNKNNVLGPACITSKFGKGSITYCSGQLGTINYQAVYRDKWEYELDHALAKILMKSFRSAIGEKPLDFEMIQAPDQLISSLWQQTIDGSDCTLVHILNATGVRMKKGDTVVYKKTLPAFPPLTKDVIFEIKRSSLKEAYITSPDYTGHRPASIEKVADGRYRVTISKDAIQAYAMVVLK